MLNEKEGRQRQLGVSEMKRRFDNIVAELEAAFRVHDKMGTYLGGVHLELTGEDVTECTGGARNLNEADLERAYKSIVDPRLNYEQAMEVAMRIAGLHRDTHGQQNREDDGQRNDGDGDNFQKIAQKNKNDAHQNDELPGRYIELTEKRN